MWAVMATKEEIKQRRLDRMRLGQAVCDYVTLPSDSEIRVAIVPLTEAEYKQVLSHVANIDANNNMAGMSLLDRVQAQEICARAIRQDDDLSQRMFNNSEEMMEVLDVVDVDEVIDKYNEMIENSSPTMDGIPPEELDALKKALQQMDWNVLSGRQWYAAKRFLSEIFHLLPPDSLRGFTSTKSSTTTNDSEKFTSTADQNS